MCLLSLSQHAHVPTPLCCSGRFAYLEAQAGREAAEAWDSFKALWDPAAASIMLLGASFHHNCVLFSCLVSLTLSESLCVPWLNLSASVLSSQAGLPTLNTLVFVETLNEL